MNKWIAEFELEDGDTMPEHMDLEYKGARIDFHCKPLKQQPTTKNDLGVDCISRQAVLDIIRFEDKWLLDAKGHNADTEIAFSGMKSRIADLPSVTPQEPQTFKWCDTCKEYDQEKHCCHRWSKVIRDTVEEMKQEPRWIPVSERSPKAEYGESNNVLVCFENETQDVLYFNGGNWCYPTGETYISVNHENGWHNKVIAWMPLHQPYREVEKE